MTLSKKGVPVVWPVVAMLMLIWPVGVCLMWYYTNWHRSVKWAVTLAFIAVTVARLSLYPITLL
jgi:membrane protein YdbS with pleckstrin-like domain